MHTNHKLNLTLAEAAAKLPKMIRAADKQKQGFTAVIVHTQAGDTSAHKDGFQIWGRKIRIHKKTVGTVFQAFRLFENGSVDTSERLAVTIGELGQFIPAPATSRKMSAMRGQ